MSVITLRLADDLKRRLQAMAESRGESLNHFIESIALQALVAEGTARRIRLPPRSGDEVQDTAGTTPAKRRSRASKSGTRRAAARGKAA